MGFTAERLFAEVFSINNGRMILPEQIERTLDLFCRRFPSEAEDVRPLRELIRQGADITRRGEFRGHVTCSALVLNDESHAMMVHHRALGRWLIPGGHLEPADLSLVDAAAREFCEEVGAQRDRLAVPVLWRSVPIHIDRHFIPANARKSEPGHEHWDFCFWLGIRDFQICPRPEEVQDAGWRPLEDHSAVHLAALQRAQRWQRQA